ncbi:mitochondrial import receptor subunit TOM70-like [Mizuhopecten yessoensis]|uniref:Mitochondrial import receptor subunit TOM70 n=1 Tax=Mizuhopecten yessoensis TaxID=6573 RepID=A0A210Q5G1_MIZYE|nr:mitochondrial import receptor subunit TOM70-like [Mizuhopecten yessoensis]OWF43976.1 Mitochondrial import receptor subunit TOM70 [Mizuhopecten yessoensis]
MAAASKSVVSDPNSTDTWPKWQVALAIGAPLAVVIGGLWVYRRSKRKDAKSSPKKQDGRDNTASPPKTGKDKSSTPSPTKPASIPDEDQTPLEKAQAEKNKGNKYFKGTRYDQAITCYTQAIRMCPPGNKTDLATFYHNRAAAYEKLRNNKMVIEDCTTALELNNRYVKALTRRASACEQLEDLSQALEDVTALCILEGFQNPTSLQTADRVLKNLGQTKAKEAFRNRKPAMPSKHFIRTYFAAFVNDPILNAAKTTTPPKPVEDGQVANGEASDVSPYQQALWKITAEEYDDIISLCTQELDLPDSQSQPEAKLLRATLYLLCNQYDLALADLKVVLSEEDIPKRLRVNAMIKRGSIYIQMEKQTEGLDDFASAVRIDPENADIYHHRGHHNIQLERIDDALRDLENAISKDPTFAASHVQKSFAEHKRTAMQMMGSNLPLPQAVLQSYKANVDMFPTNGDARALYAQALGDAGKFEEAEMQFSEAVRLDPDNATALVHRGLLKLQADKDIKEATNTINSALELDPRCEYAYEVLGTLEVQQGHMDYAMGHFQKAIEYSRTESEMSHLFSLLEAAKAQLNVAKNFGIQLPGLGGPPMV